MVVGLVSMGVPKGAARHMYWYSSWSLEDIWRGGGGGAWEGVAKLSMLEPVSLYPHSRAHLNEAS